MLISDNVFIRLSGTNLKHFEDAGYKIERSKDKKGRMVIPRGTKILVKTKDLLPTSNVLIDYICDDCGAVKTSRYCDIIDSTFYKMSGITLCQFCSSKRLSGKNNYNYKHGEPRYSEYRNNAKNRNISFELTAEEFINIVNQPCHYCGGFSTDINPRSRGNGIDRKDSSIGYIIENCVPCCSRCNYMKRSIPYQQFIDHINKISGHIAGQKRL